MMAIRIVNLRTYKPIKGETLIRVDRSTILGNPFRMKMEGDRDMVCDLYAEYFEQQLKISPKFEAFIEWLERLARTKDIALGCWCAPKRCHAETILVYINKK